MDRKEGRTVLQAAVGVSPTRKNSTFVPSFVDRLLLGMLVLMQLTYVFATQAALRLLLPYRGQELPSVSGSPRLAADLDVVMGTEVMIDGQPTNNMGPLLGLGLSVLLVVSALGPMAVAAGAWAFSTHSLRATYVLFPLAYAL